MSTKFVRSKPHVNIGTIGHVEHGNRAEAGDDTALLLRGIRRADVTRGQVIAAPGTITPTVRVRARMRLLTAAEGGRHPPITSGCRPQFRVRSSDVVGDLQLLEVPAA